MSAGTISTGRRGRSLRRFLGLVERRAGLIIMEYDDGLVAIIMMISMRKRMRKKTVKTMQLQLKSGHVTSQPSMVIVFWIYFQVGAKPQIPY